MISKNKYILALFLCLIISISTMLILYAIENKAKGIKNGFERSIKYSANLTYIIDLEYPGYYFAGATNDCIYLANSQRSLELMKSDYTLKNINIHSLNYPDTLKLVWRAARLQIDSPKIFLSEGIAPMVISGNLNDFEMNITNDSVPYFTSALSISNTSMIMNIYSLKKKQSILLKYSNDKNIQHPPTYILEKQIDGTFCTQGIISYNKSNNSIIYTFLYRNQFICLDTNLNVKYKGRTIDTNSIAKIELAQINDNKTSLASPPSVVNKYSCVDNNLLYVQSELYGDSEDYREFEKVAPIDIYSLDKGDYVGSFYIPRFSNKHKLSSFIVHDKRIIALYNQRLAVYKLRQ